jgi:hypothetical protein
MRAKVSRASGGRLEAATASRPEVFATSGTAGTVAVFAEPGLAEPVPIADVPPAVGLAETAGPAGFSCVVDSTMPRPTTNIRTAAKVRSLAIPLMDSPSAES